MSALEAVIEQAEVHERIDKANGIPLPDPTMSSVARLELETLYALEKAVREIPLGDWTAGRYDTDNESVLIVRSDGKTFDIRVDRRCKDDPRF